MGRHQVNLDAYRQMMQPVWAIEVRRTAVYGYVAIIGATPVERASLSICDGRIQSLHILHGSYDGPAWVDLASPASIQFPRLLASALELFADCLRRNQSQLQQVDNIITGSNVFTDPIEHLRWLASVRP